MKKIFLLSISFCLLSTTLFAQKIRVVSGSLDPIADAKEIIVSFTYDDMQVGKLREGDYIERKVSEYNEKEPGRGDTWHENWVNDRQERYEPKFFELFGKYMAQESKGGGMALNPDGESKYTFRINTDFTEPGFNVGIVRQNASVTLDVLVIDNETGEEVACVLIENSSANSFSGFDFDTGYRIQECYAKAGREFAKFLIKTLKL